LHKGERLRVKKKRTRKGFTFKGVTGEENQSISSAGGRGRILWREKKNLRSIFRKQKEKKKKKTYPKG